MKNAGSLILPERYNSPLKGAAGRTAPEVPWDLDFLRGKNHYLYSFRRICRNFKWPRLLYFSSFTAILLRWGWQCFSHSYSGSSACCAMLGCSVMSDSLWPVSMGILQERILQWVAMPSSRGIFPSQGSNPGLPYCRLIPYCLSHQGSPIFNKGVTTFLECNSK